MVKVVKIKKILLIFTQKTDFFNKTLKFAENAHQNDSN